MTIEHVIPSPVKLTAKAAPGQPEPTPALEQLYLGFEQEMLVPLWTEIGGLMPAHPKSQAAAHRAEQLADGVEQVFSHAGSFEDQAHEGEEGDGQQRVVGHDAEDAFRQRLEQRTVQQAKLDADQAEQDAVGSKRESHRKAEQQEQDHGRKH